MNENSMDKNVQNHEKKLNIAQCIDIMTYMYNNDRERNVHANEKFSFWVAQLRTK